MKEARLTKDIRNKPEAAMRIEQPNEDGSPVGNTNSIPERAANHLTFSQVMKALDLAEGKQMHEQSRSRGTSLDNL